MLSQNWRFLLSFLLSKVYVVNRLRATPLPYPDDIVYGRPLTDIAQSNADNSYLENAFSVISDPSRHSVKKSEF